MLDMIPKIILCTILLLVSVADALSGRITDVYWPDGSTSDGYSARPIIYIKNTDSMPREYWIGLMVRDPTGKWHTKLTWFKHTNLLTINETDMILIPVSISPRGEKMPAGIYTGKAILYADFFKHDVLDIDIQFNAFAIKI